MSTWYVTVRSKSAGESRTKPFPFNGIIYALREWPCFESTAGNFCLSDADDNTRDAVQRITKPRAIIRLHGRLFATELVMDTRQLCASLFVRAEFCSTKAMPSTCLYACMVYCTRVRARAAQLRLFHYRPRVST